jgi:hypothetical protein
VILGLCPKDKGRSPKNCLGVVRWGIAATAHQAAEPQRVADHFEEAFGEPLREERRNEMAWHNHTRDTAFCSGLLSVAHSLGNKAMAMKMRSKVRPVRVADLS